MTLLRFVLIFTTAATPGVALGTEPVDGIDSLTPLKIEMPMPEHAGDQQAPQFTLTTRFNVLVDENGQAIRVELVESSGKDWVDRKAQSHASRQTYPRRLQDDQPVQYWLEDESYEIVIRAMSNRVDSFPGDTSAPQPDSDN